MRRTATLKLLRRLQAAAVAAPRTQNAIVVVVGSTTNAAATTWSTCPSVMTTSRRWCASSNKPVEDATTTEANKSEEQQATPTAPESSEKAEGEVKEGETNGEEGKADEQPLKEEEGEKTSKAKEDADTLKKEDEKEGLEAKAAGDALDEGAEPMRWEQEYQEKDPNLEVVLDDKGQYVVSKVKWHTGELAYQTPPEPDKLAHRFGYNVVHVKKSETYWQWYRRNPHFSFRYLSIQVFFIIALSQLIAFLSDEYARELYKFQRPAGMVGEALGRGLPHEKNQKIEMSREEADIITNSAQEFYLSGKENNFIGSKDYQMKKIKRPKEFDARDFMRKELN